ncbi:MAG: hypothetical protein QM802_26500 [Agriterribacter sp.]
MDEFETEPVRKNRWHIVSPCIIGAVLAALLVIVGLAEGGYGIFGIMIGLPFFIIMVGIDLIAKHFLKHRLSYIWPVELVLIALTVLCFKLYFHELF